MHKTSGQRDPATAFPLAARRDDSSERRQANRAIAVSAAGLAVTGLAELAIAALTGSVGLLGDAIHNLSDVSTSAVVFLGFPAVPSPAWPSPCSSATSATRSPPTSSAGSPTASTPPS